MAGSDEGRVVAVGPGTGVDLRHAARDCASARYSERVAEPYVPDVHNGTEVLCTRRTCDAVGPLTLAPLARSVALVEDADLCTADTRSA